MDSKKRIAAVDMGSNSFLLTVAEPGRPSSIPLSLLHDEARVIGLSKGLLQSGEISGEAQARGTACLQDYAKILKHWKPHRIDAVGTEVFRRARNGEAVRSAFSKILGTEIQLISGDREAELSFWSCQKEHPEKQKTKIVFDIGGASTEICVGSEKGIQERISLKIGSVVLTEKFSLQEKSDGQEAYRYVQSLLADLSWAPSFRRSSVGIGVAGTITSLFAIHQKMADYNRSEVHLREIQRAQITQIRDQMLSLSLSERKKIVGLQPDRADVFSGGMTICSAICDFFEWPALTCMDSGVRFGLLYEALT